MNPAQTTLSPPLPIALCNIMQGICLIRLKKYPPGRLADTYGAGYNQAIQFHSIQHDLYAGAFPAVPSFEFVRFSIYTVKRARCRQISLQAGKPSEEELHLHQHSQEENMRLINRLNRIIQNASDIKDMLEKGYENKEILTQIAAVRTALNNLGKIILKEHMEECVLEGMSLNHDDSQETEDLLNDLMDAIHKFTK